MEVEAEEEQYLLDCPHGLVGMLLCITLAYATLTKYNQKPC